MDREATPISLAKLPTLSFSMSAATGNKQSIKILDELLQKLSIAKDETEVSAATHSLSQFINGAIEEQE